MRDFIVALILLVFLSVLYIFIPSIEYEKNVKIAVTFCNKAKFIPAGEIGIVNYNFDCNNNTCKLSFMIVDNVYCNANDKNFRVKYKVEENRIFIIGEYNDIAVRCVCLIRIKGEIYNLKKGKYELVYIFENKYIGDTYERDRVVVEYDRFCGTSTYGKCNTDEDCIISGCSNQVCQSRYENISITTCEWRECYDYRKYGYSCKCINGKCQWVRIQ